jgi:cytochrome c oxidase subunit 2
VRGGKARAGRVPLLAAGGSLLLSGCEGPLSALDPAGPVAGSIATLWWIMFWGAAALFTLVLTLFILVWRNPAPFARIAGRHWIVGGGVAMPVVILAALVFAALVLGERLLARSEDPGLWRVEVVARQWQWQFAYPDDPQAQPAVNLLRIPVGQPVELIVTSEDVIHSIWIPRLAGKIDAIPGRINRIRLRADAPGRYAGNCAEYCGIGHTGMLFEIEAYVPEPAPGNGQTARTDRP